MNRDLQVGVASGLHLRDACGATAARDDTRLEDTMKDEKKVNKLLLTRETLRRLTDHGTDRVHLHAGIRTGMKMMRGDTDESECKACPPTTDCLGC
jgi:hypothetical protein